MKTTFAADPQIQRQLRRGFSVSPECYFLFANSQYRAETARALRQQASLKSEDAWASLSAPAWRVACRKAEVADLKSGTDMIRYEVIQAPMGPSPGSRCTDEASLNPETQNYRAHITQDIPTRRHCDIAGSRSWAWTEPQEHLSKTSVPHTVKLPASTCSLFLGPLEASIQLSSFQVVDLLPPDEALKKQGR